MFKSLSESELGNSFKNLKRIIIVLYPVDIIYKSLLLSEKICNVFLNKETGIAVSSIFKICLTPLNITLVRCSKESLGAGVLM